MARLGVTKLDLVQLHWEPSLEIGPRRGLASKTPPGFVAAAQVLQQLAAEGVVGGVGVSNFDVPMLMALLDAGVTPVSNQVWRACMHACMLRHGRVSIVCISCVPGHATAPLA